MTHEIYMQRCLDLALNGSGTTSPNPMVGSVIVHKGKIIGEGWHRKAGEPHAEVNAIASVVDKSLLSESTIYVNLEPCSHYGKTPPCASLIITHKIPHIVIACQDPNPQVAGTGIKMLKDAGLQVEVGILEKEAWDLNRKFNTFHQYKRPFITLKWAQSADGFIDAKRIGGEVKGVSISGMESNIFVHKLRSEHDAILIGSQTAINDNPSLNTRLFPGRNPIRIVLDRRNRLPKTLQIFMDELPTWHFISGGIEQFGVKRSIVIKGADFLKNVIAQSAQEGVQSILVEGGAEIHSAFLKENLWDEAIIIKAKQQLQEGLEAPSIKGEPLETFRLGYDSITIYRNHALPHS